MTHLRNRQFPKTSIVKEMNIDDSLESLHSNENSVQRLSPPSPNMNTSSRIISFDHKSDDITTHTSYRNSQRLTDNMGSDWTLYDHQSPHTQHKEWKTSTEIFNTYSPNPYRKKNNLLAKPAGLRPSCSLDDISRINLVYKLTDDSGKGESIRITSTPISSQRVQYERVPVYGQQKRVLIANRYNFDQEKVDDYLGRKYKTATKSAAAGQLPHSSSSNSVVKSFFSRFKKQPKSINAAVTGMSKPMVRHHSHKDRVVEDF